MAESHDVYDVHIKLYESINLVQCRDKLLEFHTSNPDACADSDESDAEGTDESDDEDDN